MITKKDRTAKTLFQWVLSYSLYKKQSNFKDFKSVVGLVCIYSNRQDVFENVNRQRSE